MKSDNPVCKIKSTSNCIQPRIAGLVLLSMSLPLSADETETIVKRIEAHDFHPVREGFTYDRLLDKHGVADLADADWKIRTLAVRDLVASEDEPAIITALAHDNPQVRYFAAMALGIRRLEAAVPALENALTSDAHSTVRSQAAIALGHIGKASSASALEASLKNEKDRDVTHQARLSLHALKTGQAATPELKQAWKSLDPATFATAKVGETAPDITLTDTAGKPWQLSDFRGKQAVALIWIFADWCPVCHGEFRDLIELKSEFEKAGIQPVTLECHDTFRAKVMVGGELEPEYWFAKKSFRETYTEKIWWPHLVDRAATAGVKYDIQPMAFAVHAEYINRPTVALIDKQGILRFLYRGTYWGDRPTIREVLDMLANDSFDYAAPKKLPSTKN